MRAVGVIALAVLLALAPAAQASACLCAERVASRPAATSHPDCCCRPGTCRCSDCSHGSEGDRSGRSDALGGCACAKMQPQSVPESDSKTAHALSEEFEIRSVETEARPAPEPIPTHRRGIVPRAFRPLLL